MVRNLVTLLLVPCLLLSQVAATWHAHSESASDGHASSRHVHLDSSSEDSEHNHHVHHHGAEGHHHAPALTIASDIAGGAVSLNMDHLSGERAHEAITEHSHDPHDRDALYFSSIPATCLRERALNHFVATAWIIATTMIVLGSSESKPSLRPGITASPHEGLLKRPHYLRNLSILI